MTSAALGQKRPSPGYAQPVGNETRLRLLAAVQAHTELHGFSPTVRELCEQLGLKSTQSGQYHLMYLVADRLLSRRVLSRNRVLYELTEAGRLALGRE